MNDENARCAYNGEEYAQLSLVQLPVEIFLHICSFLDASTLVHGLSLVCKQFYLILKDDALLYMWKARINHIWPNATHSLLRPAKPDKLFWMSSCVAIEKQIALWKQQDSMVKLRNINPHSIRSVLLMRDATACVGATGKTLFYSKLPSREECSDEIRDIRRIDSGHYDNIYDLTAIDNMIYSCDCGNSVKSWTLTGTDLVHLRTYDIKMRNCRTCMSSCPERGLFAISSDYEIYVFESRSSNKPINQYYRPNTTITALAMNTEYILSASYDGMVSVLSVWDQRAGRIMKSITIPSGHYAVPTCMSMRRDNWVCVGDTKAKLHMLDLKNDFELVKSYSTEHTDEITGVRLMHGCLITSSIDGTVRISSLTDPPRPIATLRSKFEDILSMDYMNDTLAVSSLGIEIWLPKLRCSTKYQ